MYTNWSTTGQLSFSTLIYFFIYLLGFTIYIWQGMGIGKWVCFIIFLCCYEGNYCLDFYYNLQKLFGFLLFGFLLGIGKWVCFTLLFGFLLQSVNTCTCTWWARVIAVKYPHSRLTSLTHLAKKLNRSIQKYILNLQDLVMSILL